MQLWARCRNDVFESEVISAELLMNELHLIHNFLRTRVTRSPSMFEVARVRQSLETQLRFSPWDLG